MSLSNNFKVVKTVNEQKDVVAYGAKVSWIASGQLYELFGTVKLAMSTTSRPAQFCFQLNGVLNKGSSNLCTGEIFLPTDAKWNIERKQFITKGRGKRVKRATIQFSGGTNNNELESIQITVAAHDDILVDGIMYADQQRRVF